MGLLIHAGNRDVHSRRNRSISRPILNVIWSEYDIRGDGGSANHEPRTHDFVVQPGAIQLILEPLARPSRMLWSKT